MDCMHSRSVCTRIEVSTVGCRGVVQRLQWQGFSSVTHTHTHTGTTTRRPVAALTRSPRPHSRGRPDVRARHVAVLPPLHRPDTVVADPSGGSSIQGSAPSVSESSWTSGAAAGASIPRAMCTMRAPRVMRLAESARGRFASGSTVTPAARRTCCDSEGGGDEKHRRPRARKGTPTLT